MNLWNQITEIHNPGIQLSPGQIFTIASALRSSGESPNFLVFGCGNDSLMWHSLNPGSTLFLENHPQWRKKIKSKYPQLHIERIAYGNRTVATSLPIKEEDLAAFAVPDPILSRRWDVILVDSPMGDRPDRPGRSLPIYWASRVAAETTHVFIDDYNRPLEREYADHFFRQHRHWSVIVDRVIRPNGKRSSGRLFWSMGAPKGLTQAKSVDISRASAE